MHMVIMGCGEITSAAAQELARDGDIRLTVADRDEGRARDLAARVGARPARVDDPAPAGLRELLGDADAVLNGVGPVFRFGRRVIEAAVDTGTHCVDVCDEYDVTAEVFADPALDLAARDAGATVLLGCGASPGITNLAARWAAEGLDEVRSIDILVGVPTMPSFGVTINEHMLHALSGEVLQVIDREQRAVPAWGGAVEESLPEPFGTHTFGYMGHPEPITLARRYGLERATIRYSWLSAETNRLWQDFARLGLTADGPVPGTGLSPRGFLARLLDNDHAAAIPGAVPSTRPIGSAWRIIATGTRSGETAQVTVDNPIRDADLRCTGAELTALPAAWAARSILSGEARHPGIAAPEDLFDPEPFIGAYIERTGCRIQRSL